MPLTYLNIIKRSNFHSVTLLICNFFISGNFQTMHVVFDSTLTRRFTTELNLNCPTYIPIIITSATPTKLPPWIQSQRNEQILQLIFLDRLNEITERFKDCVVFYRIYISSTTEIERKNDLMRNLVEVHSGQMLSSNVLLLVHNPSNDSNEIFINGALEKLNYVSNESSITNIFQETFGRLESSAILGIQYTHATSCHSDQQNRRFVFPIIQRILANYYSVQMNATFFKGITTTCEGGLKFNYGSHRSSQGVYKELFFEGEAINNQTMSGLNLEQNEDHTVQLVFDSFYHFFINDNSKLSPLYPYDSTKIKVILLYGNDFRRQVVSPGLLDTASLGKHWFLFVWFIFSSLALYVIRLKLGGQRFVLFSSIWSMLIVWIGGGNLQYKHRCDKFFIVLMLFGAFFVKSFGVGNFNSNIVLQNAKIIHNFEELAKVKDIPVYLNHVFEDKKETILTLLSHALGRNITKAETKYIQNVARIPDSSIFVTVDYAVTYAELAADENERDFDIIQGSLGEFNNNYFLSSKFYISNRITEKFNHVTSSMLENGLHQFFWRFTNFLLQIRGPIKASNDDMGNEVCIISLDSFRFPLLIYMSLLALAFFTFIIEIFYAYIENILQKKVH